MAVIGGSQILGADDNVPPGPMGGLKCELGTGFRPHFSKGFWRGGNKGVSYTGGFGK